MWKTGSGCTFVYFLKQLYSNKTRKKSVHSMLRILVCLSYKKEKIIPVIF